MSEVSWVLTVYHIFLAQRHSYENQRQVVLSLQYVQSSSTGFEILVTEYRCSPPEQIRRISSNRHHIIDSYVALLSSMHRIQMREHVLAISDTITF